MSPSLLLATANVSVNDVITGRFLGQTVNVNDLVSTALAGIIVLVLGFWMRAKLTSGVPGKLQLAFESIVNAVTRQVETNIGPRGAAIVPLAVSLFIFILIANWLDLLPTKLGANTHSLLPAPTANVNMTYALALLVIILVHAASVRSRGLRGYAGHYFKPYKVLFPLNVLEEIAKPVTLALRLFGNVFAGGLMLVLIASLFPAKLIVPIPLFDVVWELFDGLFVFPIQAFIFTLLTILYFETAMSTAEH